jgi:uncharacterized repeat protein (TIGR03803 family)
LYTFTGGLDGGQPFASGVIFDPAGNLYGVTQYGGAYNQGTVFELTPSTSGTWTETVLYSFTGGSDGGQPLYNPVIDGAGNLYGTATFGGAGIYGNCGTVFKLSPSESGWTFTVLLSFTGGNDDGCEPASDLFLSGSVLVGTTGAGGPSENGAVFYLPTSGGSESILFFNGKNGSAPTGLGLFEGYLYGTTLAGGSGGGGVVFGENPYPRGGLIVKHAFSTKGKAGYEPSGDLATQASAEGHGLGIMYGTTSVSDCDGCAGTVYQLTQKQYTYPPYDIWAFSILHSFSEFDGDGLSPYAGVVLDPAGNLYGTTSWGGASPGYAGTVFKLTPGAKKWTETILYSFSGGNDGASPGAGVVLDSAGNLYGTTLQGGAYNQGVVFEVTPAAATTTTLTSSPNPSTRGQAVTFTAVVASSAGMPPDGETVSFMKGKTTLGTGLLSGGSASFTTSTLGSGTFPITAAYGGDPNFAASTSNVVEQVVTRP